jgi:KTSC domain-containing protein
MEHKPVKSSNIESIGYHPETKRMSVRFKGSGGTYSYADVPKDVYDKLMGAESVGKHFHAEIKGKYKHLKVD